MEDPLAIFVAAVAVKPDHYSGLVTAPEFQVELQWLIRCCQLIDVRQEASGLALFHHRTQRNPDQGVPFIAEYVSARQVDASDDAAFVGCEVAVRGEIIQAFIVVAGFFELPLRFNEILVLNFQLDLVDLNVMQ